MDPSTWCYGHAAALSLNGNYETNGLGSDQIRTEPVVLGAVKPGRVALIWASASSGSRPYLALMPLSSRSCVPGDERKKSGADTWFGAGIALSVALLDVAAAGFLI